MKSKYAVLALMLIYFYWGITTVLMKHILVYMNSSMYIMFRYLSAALFCSLFIFKYLKKINRQTLIRSALIGFLLLLPLEFSVLGLNYTSASNSVFISQLSIVIVPSIVYISQKQYPSKSFLLCIISILIGLGIFADVLHGGFNFGDGITLLSTFVNSMAILIIDRYSKQDDPMVLALLQNIFAAFFSVFFAIPQFSSVIWNSHSLLIIFLTGVIGTGIAYVVQINVQKFVSSIQVSLISIFSPIFGMIGAAIIPDITGQVEVIKLNKFIGAMIILMSLVTYSIKVNKEHKKPRI